MDIASAAGCLKPGTDQSTKGMHQWPGNADTVVPYFFFEFKFHSWTGAQSLSFALFCLRGPSFVNLNDLRFQYLWSRFF